MAPSTDSFWVVTAPSDSNFSSGKDQFSELDDILRSGKNGLLGNSGRLAEGVWIDWPEFKTSTLSSLLSLSETLAKQEPVVLAALTKVVDTIRTLSNGEEASLLTVENDLNYVDYLFGSKEAWAWNTAKYRTVGRKLEELVDQFLKEAHAIETVQRTKTADYSLIKGQLTNALRKKQGNLSAKSLADVVSPEIFSDTLGSEYLETVLVAVPKNLAKEWENTYEKLSSMVVPRSSKSITQDDDYILYSVVIFKKVRDDFAQKCRENKFILRDFSYDADELEKQKEDLVLLEAQEKEAWTDLLRLSRINFSDLFQITVHLKVLRAYVESVLRYGLPASYFGAILKPTTKNPDLLVQTLAEHFKPILPESTRKHVAGTGGEDASLVSGEFASVLESEFYDFVLFEIANVN